MTLAYLFVQQAIRAGFTQTISRKFSYLHDRYLPLAGHGAVILSHAVFELDASPIAGCKVGGAKVAKSSGKHALRRVHVDLRNWAHESIRFCHSVARNSTRSPTRSGPNRPVGSIVVVVVVTVVTDLPAGRVVKLTDLPSESRELFELKLLVGDFSRAVNVVVVVTLRSGDFERPVMVP